MFLAKIILEWLYLLTYYWTGFLVLFSLLENLFAMKPSFMQYLTHKKKDLRSQEDCHSVIIFVAFLLYC